MLAINVIGMLLAFVAVVALMNALISWPQHALGVGTPVTLQQFFGWLNAPFAWLLGVPAKDCGFIGQILGERIVLNEFIAYIDLSNHIQVTNAAALVHSLSLAGHASCSIADPGSIPGIFAAVANLGKSQPQLMEPRSVTLASYALCGFANFASIAIQIGGIGALCPERRGDLAKLGLKAMFCGLLACYVMTTIVGVLI